MHRRALDGARPPLLMQRTCGGSLGQALSTGRQPQHSRCSDMLQHALLRRVTACLCCCFRTGRAGGLRRVMSQVMRQGMRQAKGRKVPSLTSPATIALLLLRPMASAGEAASTYILDGACSMYILHI